MSYRIRIAGTPWRFPAEPRETLLEAGLQHGVPLPHGCTSGSCGACRARLIEGTLGERLPHDFPLGDARKAAGDFLLCRATAGSDLVIAADALDSVAAIPEQRIEARAAGMERLNEDFALLRVRTPRSRTLEFLAGQHVTLELPDAGLRRSKSVASCPCNGMLLQFHVRRRQGDPFSEYVFRRLRRGEPVVVRGPRGRCTLHKEPGAGAVLIAFETGFAPVKSLIEQGLALEYSRPMHLYWGAETPRGHYLANLCRSWADAFETFRYRLVHDLSPQALGGAIGRLVVGDHPRLGGFDIYIAAPGPVRAALEPALQAAGAGEARVSCDRLEYY